MPGRPVSIEQLRELVAKLDPDLVAAEHDVDTTLIDIALARSPMERVEFAQQMLATLLGFQRVGTPRL